MKIAEMAVLRKARSRPAAWIIKAKSSSPRLSDTDASRRFVGDVREKLENALSLMLAGCLGRHGAPQALLPENFLSLNLMTIDFRLVLVINGHQAGWCPPVQDALRTALLPLVKTMGLSPDSVAVINDDGARKWGLISGNAGIDEPT